MAFQSGVATGVIDLIERFKDFAVAQSWTLNSYANIGAGTGKRLHISKSGVFLNYRAYEAETTSDIGWTSGAINTAIMANASTGYDGGEAWDEQPGAFKYVSGGSKSVAAGIVGIAASALPYYFFAFTAPAPAIYMFVEYPTGIYQFILGGSLDKAGTWTGGTFLIASNRPEATSARNRIWIAGPTTTSALATLYVSGLDAFTGHAFNQNVGGVYPNPRVVDSAYLDRLSFDDNPVGFSGLSPLDPISLWLSREGPITNEYSEQFDPISEMGEIPNLYSVHMNGLVPGGEYPATGSGSTYRTFPVTRVSVNQSIGDSNNPPHSRGWGLAVISS